MSVVHTEGELHALALSIMEQGGRHPLSADIAAGRDPLGEILCRIRTASRRRAIGQVFTPSAIIESMIARARDAEDTGRFSAIVDPGAGSGRFTMAAATAFPLARLMAVENDPLCVALLQANASALGFTDRLTVLEGDYRHAKLPHDRKRTLFIGNPPFVRHHDIGKPDKEWYAQAVADLDGGPAGKLAGLHLHFFAATGLLMRRDDFGVFVTASEWMGTGYGGALRRLLCGRLGGLSVHEVDARCEPFPGTMATAAITVFQAGTSETSIRIARVASTNDLGRLDSGDDHPKSRLEPSPRWDKIAVTRSAAETSDTRRIGDVFRISRGAVTGKNSLWVANPRTPPLPQRFLLPCVTAAREIFRHHDLACHITETSALKRLVSLPVRLDDIDGDDRQRVQAFLLWARQNGGTDSYVARHRAAWWSVAVPPPAPIVCTYMARRPPVFVRNLSGARLLNIAHGLYPRGAMTPEELDDACTSLNACVSLGQGRMYAGGLTKFEPRTMEGLPFAWSPASSPIPESVTTQS